MKINGVRYFRAERVTSYDKPVQRDNDDVRIEKLSMKSLVRNYLCSGAQSICVATGKCECLDRCRYGQRYVELTRKEPRE